MPIKFVAVRKVTHDESMQREDAYWSQRSMAERVIAGWTLAADQLMVRGGDELPKRTGWALRRVLRSGS